MKKLLLLSGLFLTSLLYAQDPALQNDQFDEIPKIGGSDCACSQWINEDIAPDRPAQTTSGLTFPNTGVKLVGTKDQVIYQEVAVLANTDYKFTYHVYIKDGTAGVPQVEIRILKGSGYESGYTPIYYTDSSQKPYSGFGYKTKAAVETTSNNIKLVTEEFPGNTDYNTKEFTFNSGSETSIAIYMKMLDVNEIRFDWVSLTNQATASVQDVFKSSLSVYPNPTKNLISVKSKDIKIESVEVFNMLGKSILKGSLVNETIDVSNLTPGVYMLKVNSETSSSTRRIVVN
ncbi:Por secretion system C-terminal sorting domain-containing protein [Lutibacter agarilyticus]|uniref:Por secretion system C-terminal sorting domain-containing protein n=1 Tax=Lutibacter agarilyticus TaxID=1109740 RepID=A0A238Y5R6_9FLAO|nr:T9SS type A sorting domain-containing protein [Lutibacter agarilyticus]SNR65924.1 Por secretion system C-terminal sorting domain-containing protein [Lutibacter agarilyticus]